MKPVLSQVKLWLRYFFLFRGLAMLPERIGYRLAAWVGDINRRLNVVKDEALRHGLGRLFPEQSELFLRTQAREHFRMEAREILDVFYLSRRRPEDIGRVFLISGLEFLVSPRQNQGTIIVMAHYGRPIMLSTALGLAGHRIGMLSQVVDERNPFLTPVDRRYLQFKMHRTVAMAGGRWITTGDNLKVLYQALEQGETIIIMLDVVEPNQDGGFVSSFFDGDFRVPKGIFRLATKTGAHLVYGAAKERGRRVQVELRPLPADPGMAMHAAIAELERDVRDSPWQWWQWNVLDAFWRPAAPGGGRDTEGS